MPNRFSAYWGKRALLYVLQSGNLYGTERMALATLQGLDEYDARVVFATLPNGEGGSVIAAAKTRGYRTAQFSSNWELVKALLPWFIRYRRLDVIGNGITQGLVCLVMSLVMGVRLRQLHVVHGGTEDQHAYGKKHYLNRLPVRTIAVSHFVKTKLVQYGVRDISIDVIENFLSDTQLANAEMRERYDERAPRASASSPIKVAVVSRLDPIKRISLLVDALESDGLTEFQFDIYGTGLELESFRQRALQLPNIRFHGFVADAARRLSQSDVLLHLCPDEPFGLVILEAALAGVVTIVPAAGGAGDLIENGVTGFKFTPDDSEDVCRVLRYVAGFSAIQLQRVADEARNRLETRFSQRQGVDRYRQSFLRLGD